MKTGDMTFFVNKRICHEAVITDFPFVQNKNSHHSFDSLSSSTNDFFSKPQKTSQLPAAHFRVT